MSRTIWKWTIPVEDEFSLHLPAGAVVLDVQFQGSTPVIWCLVDPDEECTDRRFRVFGTGHTVVDEEVLSYVGTFQISHLGLVFHVFEYVEYMCPPGEEER